RRSWRRPCASWGHGSLFAGLSPAVHFSSLQPPPGPLYHRSPTPRRQLPLSDGPPKRTGGGAAAKRPLISAFRLDRLHALWSTSESAGRAPRGKPGGTCFLTI